MLKDITLGQYYPGNSAVHRLDPRVKILLTIAMIVGIFMVHSFAGYAAVLLLVVGASAMAQVPARTVIRSVKPLRIILLMTFFLNLFFGTGETVLVKWQFITITQEAVKNAVHYSLRLAFLVMGTSLLTLTTSPVALSDGLEMLMKPLKVIHFPSHELAMMLTIALRFIPTLLEETDKIMKAQMARGADFESGNLLARAKAMVPLLVPLFINAFRRAGDLATAMESRCYHGGEGRTRLRVLKMGKIDLHAALVMALFIALILAANLLPF